MSGPHVVLLVPDGVGVRTFVCSEFASLAAAEGRLTVWHAPPADLMAEHQAALGADAAFLPLPVRREPPVARVLRAGKRLAPVYREGGPGVAQLTAGRPARPLDRAVQSSGRVLGRVLARTPAALPAVDRLHARTSRPLVRADPWIEQLRALDPDVVLCTHQRSAVAVPPMAAARRLGIPTATFIHSWDNIPKGRMAVSPDHVLVWSAKMRDDLARHHPDLPTDRVHVVGTPQLEPYRTGGSGRPRDRVLGDLGLDPDRPVVLWSGSDRTTSPADPRYLADLADAVRDLPSRPQVLFRPSPADDAERYAEILAAHPEVVLAAPRWRTHAGAGWDTAVPERADTDLLVDLVRHVDVVANLGSTMAMDFAVLDKPAVYVSYGQPVAPGEWTADAIYRLPHFASVHATDPVHWAPTRDSLGPVVQEALTCPDRHAAGRRAWLDVEVASPLDEASRRALDVVHRIGAEDGPLVATGGTGT